MTEEELICDPLVASQQLADMRHVWLNEEARGDDHGKQNARLMLCNERDKFMKLLAQLEKEYREGLRAAGVKPGGKERAEVVDDGVARCEEIIGRLLEEWEDGPLHG